MLVNLPCPQGIFTPCLQRRDAHRNPAYTCTQQSAQAHAPLTFSVISGTFSNKSPTNPTSAT